MARAAAMWPLQRSPAAATGSHGWRSHPCFRMDPGRVFPSKVALSARSLPAREFGTVSSARFCILLEGMSDAV